MGRTWIVDASNVFGSRPDGWWRDRPAALRRLLDEVIGWKEATGEPVMVVADGHPSGLVPEGRWHGVEVTYAHSRRPDAADDEIVSLVEAAQDPHGVIVVTSDRALRDRVTELGAEVHGAKAFLERIADIEPRRVERAILARFGIDDSAMIGSGGEARVFALDDQRVLRLPHPQAEPVHLEERRRLLDAIAGTGEVTVPEVIEHLEVEGRTVVIERRLPGRDAMAVLAEPGVDRAALIVDHLAVADRIAGLACPTDRFGELWGPGAITADSFEGWATARLETSRQRGGPAFAHLDPAALTAEAVDAIGPIEPTPRLVHLDAYLGNMLADGDRITAVVDFGPMTVGGPARLDPLVAVAYLAPEITPTATGDDRAVAAAWARDAGLGDALGPVERWIAAYWTGAPDDLRLRAWCKRILLDRHGNSA